MHFLKRMFAIVLAFVMLMSFGNTVFANDEATVPEWLDSYGAEIFSKAKSYFNRSSFSGYCGTYVRCQLRAMGIFDDQFDFHGNGNQWYNGFINVEETSGGYDVYTEVGPRCIDKLVEKYGSDLRNIVVSFPVQAGYSASYPGAGHAFVIYALVDGIAYYSESFSFGSYREGEVAAESIDNLMERYARRFGGVNGCVMFDNGYLESLYRESEEQRLEAALAITIENMQSFTYLANEFINA